MKFIKGKGAREWRAISRTPTFLWSQTHPPARPRYSINRPLSNPLITSPNRCQPPKQRLPPLQCSAVTLTEGPCVSDDAVCMQRAGPAIVVDEVGVAVALVEVLFAALPVAVAQHVLVAQRTVHVVKERLADALDKNEWTLHPLITATFARDHTSRYADLDLQTVRNK